MLGNAARAQVHALTIEVAAARQRLVAKRQVDKAEYRQLMDDGEWRALQAQRAAAEKAIAAASHRLHVAQVSHGDLWVVHAAVHGPMCLSQMANTQAHSHSLSATSYHQAPVNACACWVAGMWLIR
jgi:hypothetical protein